MKKTAILILIILGGLACTQMSTQENAGYGGRQHGKMEPLSDTQRTQVITVLEKYDPESLTIKDAEAITEAFRAAGLRGGPEVDAVLEEAGFDPDELRELAPPPDRNDGSRRPDNHSSVLKENAVWSTYEFKS